MARRTRNPARRLISDYGFRGAVRELQARGYTTSRGAIASDAYLRDLYGRPRKGRKQNSPHNIAERRKLEAFLRPARVHEDKGIPGLSPEVIRVGFVPNKSGQLPKGARPLYREDCALLLDRAQARWGNNPQRDTAIAFYGDLLWIGVPGEDAPKYKVRLSRSELDAMEGDTLSSQEWHTTVLPWGLIRQIDRVRRTPRKPLYLPEAFERADERYQQMLAGLRRLAPASAEAAKDIRRQRQGIRRLFAVFFAQEVTGLAWDEAGAIYCATIRPAKSGKPPTGQA